MYEGRVATPVEWLVPYPAFDSLYELRAAVSLARKSDPQASPAALFVVFAAFHVASTRAKSLALC